MVQSCFKVRSNSVPSRTKEARAAQYINWKFGITIEEYKKKEELQLGGCAICKQSCNVRTRLGVDHDHKMNIIRDLLCHRCNAVLGLVNDNELLLSFMIDYLKRHSYSKAS